VQIRQIDEIRDHRIFRSWKPAADCPEFKPITLVYGANGSGKSSLAALLRPASSAGAWAAGVTIRVDEHGTSRSIASADDPCWDNVVVFDAGYVERAIRVSDGSTDALLALGPDAVDRQRQRAAAADRVLKAQLAWTDAKRKRGLADTARDDAGTRIAKEIASVLRKRPGFTSYTRTNVVKEMAQALSAAERAVLDRADLQARATGEAQDPVGVQALISAPATALATVFALLVEQPVASTSGLSDRSLAERDWIEEGTRLHEADECCLFCGGPVTAEHLGALQAALEAARSDLASRARDLKISVDRELAALDRQVLQLPAEKTRTLADMRDRYDKSRSALAVQCGRLRVALGRASAALDAKANDPRLASKLDFSGDGGRELADGPDEIVTDWPPVDVTVLNAVIDEHDKRCANFLAESTAAAQTLRRFVLGEHQATWTRLSAGCSSADSAFDAADEEFTEARKEVQELAGGQYDLAKGVDWINAELTRMTGRDDIRLRVADDGQQYSITRDGRSLGGLSEGEKTALALVHFLGSLMNDGRPTQDLCVVIDDPISSLDGNIATGASAVLWGELVARTICPAHGDERCTCPDRDRRMRVGQVILLTHSFELFKRWSNHVDQLGRHQLSQGRDSQQLELRISWAPGPDGIRRVPYWSVFGAGKDSRKRLRSEYHFLFDRCSQALLAVRTGTADASTHKEVQSLLPNAARRILESFLAYRRPEDLHQSFFPRLLAALPDSADAATRTALRNHLNNWSHYEETAMDDPVERPDAPVLMQSVFSFMHALDADHFHRMCASLGLTGWEHLLLPAGRAWSASDESVPMTCGRDGCDFPGASA
jgi:wobble nucleotide-excising tRNase